MCSPIKEWTPVDELNHVICHNILNCAQVSQVKNEKASFPIKENGTQPNSDVHVLLGSTQQQQHGAMDSCEKLGMTCLINKQTQWSFSLE